MTKLEEGSTLLHLAMYLGHTLQLKARAQDDDYMLARFSFDPGRTSKKFLMRFLKLKHVRKEANTVVQGGSTCALASPPSLSEVSP